MSRIIDLLKDEIAKTNSSKPIFNVIEFNQSNVPPQDPDILSGGTLWSTAGSTSSLIYTDNTGVDHNLTLGGGGSFAPLVHTHSVSDITSGTLSITRGGTGQSTATAALNALLPSQTGNNGKLLSTDGLGSVSWISAGGQVDSVSDDSTATGATLKSSESTATDIRLKSILAGTNITVTTSGTGDIVLATLATATQPEADAGSVTNKIITPSTLAGYIDGKTETDNLSSSATTYWTSLSTKQYADSIASGFSQKAPCVIASIANVVVATGTLTPSGLDTGGPALNVDDHVLLKDQADPTENGVYHAKTGTWVRADDMDGTPSTSEVTVGVATFVINGSTWAGYNFVATSPGKVSGNVISLGVDAINWSPISQISNDASSLTSGTLAAARLPLATTTAVGALETATQEDATDGIATDKIITPATLKGFNVSGFTSGALPIARGGTGQTTANTSFNALVPTQTANLGKYLTTDGTDTSWATVGSSATNIVCLNSPGITILAASMSNMTGMSVVYDSSDGNWVTATDGLVSISAGSYLCESTFVWATNSGVSGAGFLTSWILNFVSLPLSSIYIPFSNTGSIQTGMGSNSYIVTTPADGVINKRFSMGSTTTSLSILNFRMIVTKIA